MNWDAIGAIGEIIGAAGVLISLLYLASQIRKNTHAIESSAHQGMLHQHNSLWTLLLTDEKLGKLVERGEDEPQTLTEKEWNKFVKFAFMHVNLWENAFINHQKGTITTDVFKAWDIGARYTFDHVGYQKFWGENRAAFHVDFVKHVEPFFADIKGTRNP